jgi:HEAT repeat protein
VVQDWQAILSPLMERSEARIRLPAARLLLRAGNREAVPVLQEGLKNADLEDRRANARALAAASITDRRLISQLLEDPDIEIRRTALDLAVNLAPVRARAILREVLQSPTQEPDVQTKALFLLQDLGDAEDVEMILDLAHGTESDFVAVNTIMALGRIEGRLRTQRSLPYFREILEDPDADHALVSGVITALQEIGDDSFLPLLAHRLRHCAGACWSLGPELSSTIGILLGRRLHGTTFGRPERQP